MGREYIFPAKLDPLIPSWLNHSIHTMIVPVNLITVAVTNHKYYNNGVLMTIGVTTLYTVVLQYIKRESGLYVYPYLETFDEKGKLIYFSGQAIFAYLMYKSGQLLTYAIHTKRPPEGVRKMRSANVSTARKQN